MGPREPIFAPDRLKVLILARPFDTAGWMAASSPCLHVRIGAAPPCIGRAAALDALRGLLGRCVTIGAEYCEVWLLRGAIHVETDLRCPDAQGRLVTLPCVIIVRTARGLLIDLRFYLDRQPLGLPAARNGTCPM